MFDAASEQVRSYLATETTTPKEVLFALGVMVGEYSRVAAERNSLQQLIDELRRDYTSLRANMVNLVIEAPDYREGKVLSS